MSAVKGAKIAAFGESGGSRLIPFSSWVTESMWRSISRLWFGETVPHPTDIPLMSIVEDLAESSRNESGEYRWLENSSRTRCPGDNSWGLPLSRVPVLVVDTMRVGEFGPIIMSQKPSKLSVGLNY